MGFIRRLLPATVDEHDPALDAFDKASWELMLDGEHAGYVSSTLSRFRTPFRPFTKQDWVWMLLVWPDGTREFPIEDYPPWSSVRELQHHEFVWGHTTYTARRLSDDDRVRVWAEFGITEADF